MTTHSGDVPTYALRFSEEERQRYRLMAGRAREQEADLWTSAGIRRGARVADIGCGPGAVLGELARIVGDGGEVVGVEPRPVAPGGRRGGDRPHRPQQRPGY